MISTEDVPTRLDVAGPPAGDGSAATPPAPRRSGRPAGVRAPARPGPRGRRAPERAVRPRGRGPALCPDPVVPSRAVPAGPRMLLRRAVAGAGLVVASAAVVFGLGLLADASAAPVPDGAGAPVPVVAGP